MPKTDVLIDSGFIYALYDKTDPGHVPAGRFMKVNQARRIVPDVVLPEVTFLLDRFGGQPAVEFFLQSFEATKPELQPLQFVDLSRAREILRAYPRARLDFVDCCIMAISERLNITRVCAFDHRDFSIFRPTHCDYLELLP